MGNCLPKLKKKNKISPSPRAEVVMKKETTVSEILSRSSTSVSLPSLSSDEEITMVQAFKVSSDDDTPIETQSSMTDELIVSVDISKYREGLQKPVCFQVDYVQGMPHRMPSRLADRMEAKVDTKTLTRQLTITEEDEILMDEIVEEVEARELLARLEGEQIMAQISREKHLAAIRRQARRMSLGLSIRAGRHWEAGLRGEREG